jgi:hypothetical protein
VTPVEDGTGRHLELVFDCVAAGRSWRARAKRLLSALGLRRAANRLSLRARVDIKLFAIQPISGSLLDSAGAPRHGCFVDGPPRVGGIELQMTEGQGTRYYLLLLRTDKGDAEIPAFETEVRWRQLPP